MWALSLNPHPCAHARAFAHAQGYRTARATHGVSAGAWYFEVEILKPRKPNGHVRWVQRRRRFAPHRWAPCPALRIPIGAMDQ